MRTLLTKIPALVLYLVCSLSSQMPTRIVRFPMVFTMIIKYLSMLEDASTVGKFSRPNYCFE